MKKIPFEKASFYTSVADVATLPATKTSSGVQHPEIAIAGRSNVGKSSLINHLLGQKKLARTSSVPGKTQLLNFFLIDERLYLVDLPGYGFAKVSKTVQQKWTKCLADYFDKRKSLQLILLLLDIRRTPSEEDLALLEWASYYSRPLCIIFTKCDKVSKTERTKQTKDIIQILQTHVNLPDLSYIHFSIHDNKARDVLIDQINDILAKHL